jgi:hypothetical protein
MDPEGRKTAKRKDWAAKCGDRGTARDDAAGRLEGAAPRIERPDAAVGRDGAWPLAARAQQRALPGLARSGNARVRRGMIQLAWRFLIFQKDSASAQWFRSRTENVRGTRKTMIVAFTRPAGYVGLWH